MRERKEDIALLLDLFLAQAAKEFGKKMPSYPKELIPLLENYSFPGNIREFKGMVFDAMTLHKSRMLSMDAFKRVIDGHAPVHGRATLQTNSVFNDEIQLPSLKEVASLLVVEAMKRSRGNQSLAARLLGISQPALSKRLKKLSEE